jgi:imidazolonepropionase-like amidohydrolase
MIMLKHYLFLLSIVSYFLLFACTALAQISSPHNGAPPSKSRFYGIKNATIILEDGEILENASLLIEDHRISKIGSKVSFPDGTTVYDYTGKTILAAFVELSSDDGVLEKHNHKEGRSTFPQFLSNKLGPYYWNESIAAENSLLDAFNFEDKQSRLEQMGFGFVVPNSGDGIARGWSPLIAIGADNREGMVLHTKIASFFSLEKGSSRQTYPSSQMGAIALIRQAFIDAQWYEKTKNLPLNYSLAALAEQLKGKIIFEAQDKLEVLRISKILEEFDLKGIIRCGGDEYQRMDQIKKLKHDFILPLCYPEAIDVSNPFIAKEIPLQLLKHWELAPYNAYAFHRNKLNFALSGKGIKSSEEFWKAVRKTILSGLPWEIAYAALTHTPANMLGVDNQIGSLKEGVWASFNVYSDNPFLSEKAELLESWQLGKRKIHKEKNLIDIRGNFNINLNGTLYTMFVKGSLSKPSAQLSKGADIQEKNVKDLLDANLNFDGNNVTISFKNGEGAYLLNGQFYSKLGTIEGNGIAPDGSKIKWTAIRHKNFEEKKPENVRSEFDTAKLSKLWYPNMAYGLDSIRKHNNYLIRNATIWTGEKEGVIENGDILVQNGKIKYVGKGTFNVPRNTKVIDAKGKVVTAGIIDEHSHICISKGVNESGLSITSEVSIETVVNPEDINMYRQLAGGVTCAQLLHGSANAIGGQSAIIKFRWGYDAEGILLENAPKFIKFALGENVKQSNWGDHNVTRFPQSRMGVEQVFYDAFYQAKHYLEEWEDRKKKKSTFRRDLRLEALAEILQGQRNITCHSYVQSEVNMLMKVADSMGFKVKIFTHILEGYKLIPQLVKHGAGGSTFSDWWAYKYEVIDAIPHNACLMNKGGVVTGINSDDPEMGRRLNQEAAKGLKYGGMSEQEAWLMVTLNPAKLLNLDDRMGSIKVGKDADLVIWSENPLSINAVCEQTFIDGVLFYDIREQEMLRKRNEKERARIIASMLEATKNGEPTTTYILKRQPLYHCDTEEHHTHSHGH